MKTAAETEDDQAVSTSVEAVTADHLTKTYHHTFKAVDDFSLSVHQGEIFGLLGPNGAGKTTTVKMITTLTKPSAGTLKVFGIDVVKSPQAVRGLLGYVPQSISVDGDLTAYENLLIFSKLFYVARSEREERIANTLEYMGLSGRADDIVKHYSGGMMRRLEIAQALVNRPKILFLDEPSIGLDPNSKRQVWEGIHQINDVYGATIFITTHDMAEADELCDRLAIMDQGRIAVLGRPSELKRGVGSETISITLSHPVDDLSLPQGMGILTHQDDGTLQIHVEDVETSLPRVMNFLLGRQVPIKSVSTSKPTLDDVFIKYTRRTLRQSDAFHQTRAIRRSFQRRTR